MEVLEMRCRFCNEIYTPDEVAELREMHEEYWSDGASFICPGCWDDLQRKTPAAQVRSLLEAQHVDD